jgi:hypothetical protein
MRVISLHLLPPMLNTTQLPSLSNIGKVLLLGSPYYRVPNSQRTFPFPVLFPGFFELPPTDNPHKRSSHIAKLLSIESGTRTGDFKKGSIPEVRAEPYGRASSRQGDEERTFDDEIPF